MLNRWSRKRGEGESRRAGKRVWKGPVRVPTLGKPCGAHEGSSCAAAGGARLWQQQSQSLEQIHWSRGWQAEAGAAPWLFSTLRPPHHSRGCPAARSTGGTPALLPQPFSPPSGAGREPWHTKESRACAPGEIQSAGQGTGIWSCFAGALFGLVSAQPI